MEKNDNTNQNNRIPLKDLPKEKLEEISNRILKNVSNPVDWINSINPLNSLNLVKPIYCYKNLFYNFNKEEDEIEDVFQLRANNDSRMYKTPDDVNDTYTPERVWENGKTGYFIPFDYDSWSGCYMKLMNPDRGKDGKGLRFVQTPERSDGIYYHPQNNEIIVSGFGEYVLENWGKDLSKLYEEYTENEYRKRVEQWRKDNYPYKNKIDKQIKLQLLNEFKIVEQTKWDKATISEFFDFNDNRKLNQCMNEYFNWLDKCIQIENEKEEKQFIDFIKSGTISNNWVNGKSGQFQDFDNTCLYRFCEMDKDCHIHLLKKEEEKKLPVLACGFVAWLIKHWGTNTQAIYSSYLQARLNKYKTEHKNDADVFKRDLEREFYDQYKTKEEQWVKQSEAIFEFVSDVEVNQIKEYVRNYFEYVNSLSNPLAIDEYTKESEIIKNTRLRTIYFAIRHTPRDYPPNKNIYSQYTPIQIINDLRRIEQHHEEKPDECISYFFEKYHTKRQILKTPTIFVECLKLFIDNHTVFMIMLLDRYMFPNTETQKQFALELNKAQKQVEPDQRDEALQTKPEQTKYDIGKPQQNFADYLHHENKNALMKKLHELLDGKTCKTVAITIKALTDLSYLIYGSKNNLYDTMRKEFSFSGTDSGLNKFLNSNNNGLSEIDIKPTKDILQAVK
ncbi:hypothetical protein [Dysgonomonas termitidis]|uniref:Uncharacterized protein n=1 Tax=Dysgonomonas termitidis TaxID=1516126 RepID=A0ABV9L3F1_9BACT